MVRSGCGWDEGRGLGLSAGGSPGRGWGRGQSLPWEPGRANAGTALMLAPRLSSRCCCTCCSSTRSATRCWR